MLTIATALKKSKLPLTETEIILSHIIKKDRSYLNAFPEKKLTSKESFLFENFVRRRERSEPLAYILGIKEFYGLKFFVNSSVLIPRPETERLVAEALAFLKTKSKPIVVDVGTGSGCIAIAVGKSSPKISLYATDISSQALLIAKKNAVSNKVHNVKFLKTNLIEEIPNNIDLLLANLPYIPTINWRSLPANIRNFEHRIALDSGKNSMNLYKKLFDQARKKLKHDGRILFEMDGDIIQLSADDLVGTAPEQKLPL